MEQIVSEVEIKKGEIAKVEASIRSGYQLRRILDNFVQRCVFWEYRPLDEPKLTF